eukprot:TRINITY_DN1778_c0_g1_i3.p1 TRINITY_DN1778_c0_g1~~TRINITY_DN1778_c0_g1_i3.p1  ORF type:complete len:119 (-),score=4.08 TRINITY_DN1778_c0_g1_i3:24-380(-)
MGTQRCGLRLTGGCFSHYALMNVRSSLAAHIAFFKVDEWEANPFTSLPGCFSPILRLSRDVGRVEIRWLIKHILVAFKRPGKGLYEEESKLFDVITRIAQSSFRHHCRKKTLCMKEGG